MHTPGHYNIGPFEVWRYLHSSGERRFHFERWRWSDGRYINKPRVRLGRWTYCAAWWTPC